jgi:histidine triad (HIT) family protein
MYAAGCTFCRIAQEELPAAIVFEDDLLLGFLDSKPLFHGHVLLIPKDHVVTLADVEPSLLTHLFSAAQRLSVAVQAAMAAEGTFVAMNNVVSQSVPHFHVHIVPRRKGDGLRGFFWPRTTYATADEMNEVRDRIAGF